MANCRTREKSSASIAAILIATGTVLLYHGIKQQVIARAAERWPTAGTPSNPAGWLYTTAHRQIVGGLRAEAIAGRKAPLLAVRPGWVPPEDAAEALTDDRLHLILLCCHPALDRDTQVALTLRLVAGLTTTEIAHGLWLQEATLAQRIVRAKR